MLIIPAIGSKSATAANQVEHSLVDREAELQRLARADRHISDAERNITDQLRVVDQLREDGHNTKLAEQTLRGFEAALNTLLQHRELIVRTIAQIDQGLI